MAVNLQIPSQSEIYAVAGVDIGIAAAGIRKPDHNDLTIFNLADNSRVAGVFTQNRFCAAPVHIAKAHLASGKAPRAFVINTGNANAGTGEAGKAAALQTCTTLAKLLKLHPEQVLPFSTGVILESLPTQKICDALPHAVEGLTDRNWFHAAHSIMTTDTQPKIASQRLNLGTETVHVTGISKGSGMIRPNMATMLAFIATDVGLSQPLLDETVQTLADQSFNRITVDGDTSTNDAFMLIATGESNVQIQTSADPRYPTLLQTLREISLDLAQKIVRDGEGATKFITIRVSEAKTPEEALQVAYAIAHSPLVKTAFFASDPNLGRILSAIGNAPIATLDPNQINLWLDDVHVFKQGERNPDYREDQGQQVMQQQEIEIHVALGQGNSTETIYTSDLSHDYVSINADYRS